MVYVIGRALPLLGYARVRFLRARLLYMRLFDSATHCGLVTWFASAMPFTCGFCCNRIRFFSCPAHVPSAVVTRAWLLYCLPLVARGCLDFQDRQLLFFYLFFFLYYTHILCYRSLASPSAVPQAAFSLKQKLLYSLRGNSCGPVPFRGTLFFFCRNLDPRQHILLFWPLWIRVLLLRWALGRAMDGLDCRVRGCGTTVERKDVRSMPTATTLVLKRWLPLAAR